MVLETLQKEMIAAMKAKNKLRKDAISSLIGAIKKAAIDEKCRDTISDELANKVILKEKKTMQDMIDTCPTEREDLLNEYKHKMATILEFVPKMMSEVEIKETIVDILANETVYKNVGAIMKVVMPKLKGKADGKLINKVVSDIIKK
jgi:uncharacterized protein YqeY